MKHSRPLTAAALCAAFLLSAHDSRAAERGWYAGAAFSNVSADYAPPIFVLTGPALFSADTPSRIAGANGKPIGSHGFKLVAGYGLLDWLAFEANYLGFDGTSNVVYYPCIPQSCLARNRAKSSAVTVSTLVLWPLGRFDLFARVGIARWKVDVEGVSETGSVLWSEGMHGTDETFGGGVQFRARRITTRIEYERLRFSADVANTWSLGFAYSFR